MSLTGYIKNLFVDKEKTIPLFPKTKVKAVSDDNGIGLNVILDEIKNEVTPMSKGGTGATTGATGLRNMFADGKTVLSSYQYGSELPSSPTAGQVFFQEATGTIADIGQDVAKAVRAVNLLDNSDFRNPINQRGANGAIPTWTYCIDRWRTGSNTATISINNGLVCTGYISQIIAQNYDGKTLTFAAKINGEIFCCSAEINAVTAWTQFARKNTNVGSMAICKWDDNIMYVEINNTSEGTIEWVALYEGEYTAETLPPYVPKGYGVELAECRRYFRRYAVWQEMILGYVAWDNKPRIVFLGEPAMRVTPTASRLVASLNCGGTIYYIDETPKGGVANREGSLTLFLGELSDTNNTRTALGGYLTDIEFTLSADL